MSTNFFDLLRVRKSVITSTTSSSFFAVVKPRNNRKYVLVGNNLEGILTSVCAQGQIDVNKFLRSVCFADGLEVSESVLVAFLRSSSMFKSKNSNTSMSIFFWHQEM